MRALPPWRRTWIFAGVVTLALSAVAAWADTLVLRNGNRITGRLLAVRDGVIEFEEDRGPSTRVVRVDQREVRTLEFDPVRGNDRERVDDRGSGSPPNGRPRGLRERVVSVAARSAWTDTGVAVRDGQTVYFTAAGRVRWGPRRQDGPAGESDSPRNPARPIPSRPGAALIGRIGDDAPFFIGADEGGIRVRSSGQLFLGINDDVLDDNSGAFDVVVYF